MALALQLSKHLIRKGAFPAFSQLNACRTLVCSSNNLAKLGTAPQPHLNGMMLPSTEWKIERIVAISMLPMYPIALLWEPYASEYVVATAVSLHAYWGLDSVIRDYAMERRYGPYVMPTLRVIWAAFCGVGFAGLCYFNYYDMGIIKGVKKLWHF